MKQPVIDPTKSINQLSGHADSTGPFASSSHEAFNAACAAPIGTLDPVDLRRLIVQDAELEIIVRYLLDRIEAEPGATVDGEWLLDMLLDDIPQQFWVDHGDIQTDAVNLIHGIDKRIPEDFVGSAIAFLEINTGTSRKRDETAK